jgi:hypothetical protein
VVGGLAWLLGGGPDGSSEASDASSPTPTPSESTSTSPTDPGSTTAAPPARGDKAKAIASFADALAKQGAFTAEQSTCVARETVETVGLANLVAAGFFDADLVFLDPDLADHPEIKSALTSATVTCLT